MTDTVLRLIGDEMRDTTEYLRTLTPAQWDAPSLCAGWRVRDVVGHMASGLDLTMPQVIGGTIKRKGDAQRFSYYVAIEWAEGKTPDELIAGYERQADGLIDQFTTGRKHGLLRMLSARELMVDHLIHHEDVRRPFHADRVIDEERLEFSLRALPEIGGLMKLKHRIKGLRLRATDVSLTIGDDGPPVEGSAVDLVLVASGRVSGLDGLTGEGVATLQERLKS